MGKVVRWSPWLRNRSQERHYSHRYACAIESLVDAGFFNDAVTSTTHSPRPRPRLVDVSPLGPDTRRSARVEVA